MNHPGIGRRALLAGGLLLPAWPVLARAAHGDIHVTLLGQSLIQQDICAIGWPGQAALVHRLKRADAVFTDLETAITLPGATPTRAGEVLHAASPGVIDCLKQLGVSLVATSNNHAWDLGTPGIIAALAELDRRGISHAGSGSDLAGASSAGFQPIGHGQVALVSAAAGAIRDGAAASATRAGVNELRRDKAGALDEDDVARTLASIRAARRSGATVIAYLHNHYWEPDPATTPEWQRAYARHCIDAGAAIFVSHGPPLLQGIELYRGVPLLHGLGSFIFQTRKAEGSYGPATWQSLAVEAVFRNGAFVRAVALPVQLDASKPAGAEFTRGVPALADGSARAAIRQHLAALSARLGTRITVKDGAIVL